MYEPLSWVGYFYPFLRVVVSMIALHWLYDRLWFIKMTGASFPDHWSPAITGALQWTLFWLGLHLVGAYDHNPYPMIAYWVWAWFTTMAVFYLPYMRSWPIIKPCNFQDKRSIPLIAGLYQIAIWVTEMTLFLLWLFLRLLFN